MWAALGVAAYAVVGAALAVLFLRANPGMTGPDDWPAGGFVACCIALAWPGFAVILGAGWCLVRLARAGGAR